jgi:hypothetical protein
VEEGVGGERRDEELGGKDPRRVREHRRCRPRENGGPRGWWRRLGRHVGLRRRGWLAFVV